MQLGFWVKKLQRDQTISGKRVHIDCVIGLAKTLKVMTIAQNRTEKKFASHISFAVSYQQNIILM